jgi:hypothetical protein
MQMSQVNTQEVRGLVVAFINNIAAPIEVATHWLMRKLQIMRAEFVWKLAAPSCNFVHNLRFFT